MRRLVTVVVALAALVTASAAAAQNSADTARYILPPGNFGGLPTTTNSLDQLPLYDALTPLRRNVSNGDIRRLFLPADFTPIGQTRVEPTGRPGLRLVYDAYGVPHVYGRTRYDVSFGAGWTTARDRGLLVSLARGPARAAVVDVPGLDAFSLVTSGQGFTPSAQAEAELTRQVRLLRRSSKGRQIVNDLQASADGINAYWRANDINQDQPPANVNDLVAVTAFIGSIFGAGGGGEAENAELLSRLQNRLGRQRGLRAWDDVMLADDPEAPTTTNKRFSYGPLTGGPVGAGSVALDAGSVEPVPDPRRAGTNAAAAPARRRASNWLLVSPQRSASGNSLGVMGPQLGYYYPEIVQQIHLEGPGIKAQGAAVPGLSTYILIGRTADYAWSLTSAGHDVRDVYAERLCEADGSAPTRTTNGYRYRGRCRAFTTFNAGTLAGRAVTFRRSVHGAVIGTATIGGVPYALTRKRSTFGRDALNLAALKDMTEGRGSTPERFFRAANQFGFTFNWAYASRRNTAFFSSGLLPKRPRGLDRRLPTLGTGQYEWNGYLSEREHPHDVGGPGGLLRNWNNRSAPGFMHGDDEPYGSAQRVELFDKYPSRPTLADDVGIMNRAATEDVRSPVWPVVSRVLRTTPAPSARAQQVVDVLDDWVRRDAPRLDATDNGDFDDAGPVIMDALFRPLTETVMRDVFSGDLLEALDDVRGLGGQSGHSYVDKDLRTLLGGRVRGKFNLRYCGGGSLAACRTALWTTVDQVGALLSAQQGGRPPAAWRKAGDRTGFQPGLIPNTFRTTNRPTYQQVLEFQR